jgi:hypothetical protein
MVGVDLPADLLRLVLGAADSHGDSIDGMIIWAPYGASNEGIGLDLGLLGREESPLRAEGRQKKRGEEKTERK